MKPRKVKNKRKKFSQEEQLHEGLGFWAILLDVSSRFFLLWSKFEAVGLVTQVGCCSGFGFVGLELRHWVMRIHALFLLGAVCGASGLLASLE